MEQLFGQAAVPQTIGIIVPTYNAETHWPALEASLRRQAVEPAQVLVIDSSSQDRTHQLAQSSGFQVLRIPQSEFNHGRTRQLACDMLPDAEYLVYLTQDATLPNADAVTRLCRALADPCVGAAYGRQLPRESANPIERHARLFNYPAVSHRHTFSSRNELGIKAAFCSNSFAVYRRSALLAVGGFPADVILGEDSVVAARLLMAGWQVIYQADAVAIHSHPLSLWQEFCRYFDTGVHHGRQPWLLATFGTASAEGRSFVQSELRYLLRHAPHLLPEGLLRTCNKLLAYRLGRAEAMLPRAVRRGLSAHPGFWAAGDNVARGAVPVPAGAASPGRAAVVSGPAIDPSASM